MSKLCAEYYKIHYEKVYKQLQEVLSDLCDGDCDDCKYKQICENREW